MSNFLSDRSKGQVFVIIGIVMAMALVLIQIKTNFDAVLREKKFHMKANEDEIFKNLENEFRESYDIAVKKGSHEELNETVRNFTLFVKDRMKTGDFKSLYSFSVYDNSDLKISVWNFLGRELKQVNISQSLTGGKYECGRIPSGESCFNQTNASGKNVNYHVNVTYIDGETGKRFTKTYHGYTGSKGNYTAIFYRLEFELGSMKLTGEGRAKSKPI